MPLPGGGHTLDRWRALATLAAEDVCLAKWLEAHYDAQAILMELEGDAPGPGQAWGVWAAEPPGDTLALHRIPGQRLGRLHGTKSWCSAATSLTHALVTVREDEARVLVAVALDDTVQVDASGWQAVGMRRIETARVEFNGTTARVVGRPGEYIARAGFWHGGAGIAACWFGATRAIAERLRADRRASSDPHAAAHLGAIDVRLSALAAVLRETAALIDEAPTLPHQREVMQLRGLAEDVAQDVIARCGRALGAGPLCAEGDHAQRCADLLTFLRQHHAERDLEGLGKLAAQEEDAWRL
ncbi:acyl-CoA dehydrogenase family protein [Stenotrophomonas sp. HITSZ_GD]|uniref:acyl-CoA dehydrogenase family protein n=1 Tax=Stenotrophomonas sp. HITSZ_GD TaxID=3037248 RepID=UPI0031F322C9